MSKAADELFSFRTQLAFTIHDELVASHERYRAQMVQSYAKSMGSVATAEAFLNRPVGPAHMRSRLKRVRAGFSRENTQPATYDEYVELGVDLIDGFEVELDELEAVTKGLWQRFKKRRYEFVRGPAELTQRLSNAS